MRPRLRFVLACAIAAVLLQTVVFMALAVQWWGMNPAASLRQCLLWLPAPLLATALAAWLSTGWHARAAARGRQWGAFALAWRTVLMALVLYPFFVGGWMLLTALGDQRWAAQPAPLQDTWALLPTVVGLAAGFAVVLGGPLALVVGTVLSGRYLRKSSRGHATGKA